MVSNLDDLKDRLNIVEIVEHFVPLRKSGANYMACCPFHSEKTPSFSVSPTKNMYMCFGCGASGDAIKFVMEYQRLDFNGAIELIAQIVGFVLEHKQSDNGLKEAHNALDEANNIFKSELANEFKSGGKIAKWLENRGASLELCQRYDIGFCNANALKVLKAKFKSDILHKAGILNNDKCFLFDRISFALRGDTHKVKGFSGRSQPYSNFKNAAKYINSRESDIFKKSFLFYALTLAKSEIIKKGQIIVCEGFFDTIAYHKFGYTNAVCTIGTAFNKAHLAHIFRLKDELEIIFSFDNDSAGIEANARALKLCFDNAYFNISVVKIDSKDIKDLGECLKDNKKPNLVKIKGFKYYSEFVINSAKSTQAKDRAFKELESIAKSAPPFQRAELVAILNNIVAKYVGESPIEKAVLETRSKAQYFCDKNEALKPEREAHTKAYVTKREGAQSSFLAKKTSPLNEYGLENRIIATMLQNDEFKYIAKTYLSKADFVRAENFEAALESNLKALALYKDIAPLSSESWSENLEAFKLKGLQRSLEIAKKSNDIKQMIALREAIENMQKIVF